MYTLSIVSLLLATTLMCFGAYLYFWDDNPPIVFNKQPTVTVSGDYLHIYFDYCKFTDKPATMDISFIDTFIYNLPSVQMSGLQKGECKQFEYQLLIPENLPAGKYTLHGKNTYQINVLTTRTVEWESNSFPIIR